MAITITAQFDRMGIGDTEISFGSDRMVTKVSPFMNLSHVYQNVLESYIVTKSKPGHELSPERVRIVVHCPVLPREPLSSLQPRSSNLGAPQIVLSPLKRCSMYEC
jgi:hypothetical protein